MTALMGKFDTDNDGYISFEEFIGACYVFIKEHDTMRKMSTGRASQEQTAQESIRQNILRGDEEDEVEEVPEEFTDLSPDEQQRAIKKRAFIMLTIGTLMVVVFSDPMVDVMNEIAVRLG